MQNSAATRQRKIQSDNAYLRQLLLATAVRNWKQIAVWNGPNTTSARFKIFNVGVLLRLRLLVSASLAIGTAIAVPSFKAPWNFISRIQVTDYDGTNRVSVSGFQLFLINCVRNRSLWSYYNNNVSGPAIVNAMPVVPTAVATAALKFFIDIPIAFDVDNPVVQMQDLRGAILNQTNVGEMFVTIDWNQSLYTNNDVESVYMGAGTTTVAGSTANFITATLWQQYLLPQAVGANGLIPLPPVDLLTVYELNGAVRSSDNLAVGQEKFVNFPNVRTVIGVYFNYIAQQVSATGMAFANMGNIKLIANGNNILEEDTNESHVFKQRLYCNSDTVVGAYFKVFREKPIETALYGNMQISLTPAVVGTNANVEFGVESFYTKGAALPALQSGS